ncbi:hypothetical protein ACFPPD_11020 [Cohnella suwonensis]|uniref:Uncharacterized protein n=1 Tax=Cohnella suwonensis TaxID=696072 RepID=A0ABW0LWN0_9BACL
MARLSVRRNHLALMLSLSIVLSLFGWLPRAAAAANEQPVISESADRTLQLNGTDAAVSASGIYLKDFTAELWARSDSAAWSENGFLLSSQNPNGFILSPVKGTTTMDVYLIGSTGGKFKLSASFHVDDITQ